MTGGRSRATSAELLAGTLHGRPRKILRSLILPIIENMVPLRLRGIGHVPKYGRLIVASNHLSNADPILLELAFPRPLFFMGKVELFDIPLFRWILHRFGGFPVERGTADRAALRHAQTVVNEGIAVGVYPEGGRSLTYALVPGYSGTGLLALQTRAPILPVAIYGTEFFPVNGEWPPHRPKGTEKGVTLIFGRPFTIPVRVDDKRVTPAEATFVIMMRIAELLPEQYRGSYAS